METPPFYIYTVYHDPADYPGKYVVRPFDVSQGLDPVACPTPLVVTDTLEDARAKIPPWCVMFVRSPGDEPQIVETWV